MVDRMAVIRKARNDKGLCAYCGLVPYVEGSKRCQPCRELTSKRSAAYQAKVVSEGYCPKCTYPRDTASSICSKCTESMRVRSRELRKINKQIVVSHFGGVCKECKESDIRCMTLDHIDNNGRIEQTTKSGNRIGAPQWYARLAKLIVAKKPIETNLQLLCFNCHAKKDLFDRWIEDEN